MQKRFVLKLAFAGLAGVALSACGEKDAPKGAAPAAEKSPAPAAAAP